MELSIERGGIDARERRFAASRRSPQYKREQMLAFYRLAQRLTRADQMLLPDELIERLGPYLIGQRFHSTSIQDSYARGDDLCI